MRIDGTSLIAAQSALQAQRAQKVAPAPAQTPAKPLFEALNLPKLEEQSAPAKPPNTGVQTPSRRLGAQLDITV